MASILFPTEREYFLKNQKSIMKKANEDNYKTFVDSPFGFWSITNGPRPGRFHLIVGPAGCGKSTLTKSNVLYWAKKYKVMLILSEEHYIDYFSIAYSAREEIMNHNAFDPSDYIDSKNFPTEEEVGENVLPIVEREGHVIWEDDINIYEKTITQQIEIHDPDIIVYDNFTTGIYSDYDLKTQKRGVYFFSNLAHKFNKPVIALAHTRKYVPAVNDFFSMNDCEGSNSLIKIADHLATFVKIQSPGRTRNILTLHKHRNYSPEMDQLNYQFRFQRIGTSGIYVRDENIPCSAITKIKLALKE